MLFLDLLRWLEFFRTGLHSWATQLIVSSHVMRHQKALSELCTCALDWGSLRKGVQFFSSSTSCMCYIIHEILIFFGRWLWLWAFGAQSLNNQNHLAVQGLHTRTKSWIAFDALLLTEIRRYTPNQANLLLLEPTCLSSCQIEGVSVQCKELNARAKRAA